MFQVSPVFLANYNATKKIIVNQGGTSAGKCLGKGTFVRMFDLSLKKVEDIIVGDLLMGPDGNKREVLRLYRGMDQMYWIRQNKGIDYRVNSQHLLPLMHSGKDLYKTVKQVKIYQGRHHVSGIHVFKTEWLYEQSKRFKRQYNGFKSGIERPYVPVPIDPYYLGVWLGDGSSGSCHITNVEPEIEMYLRSFVKTYPDLHFNRDASDKNVWIIAKNPGIGTRKRSSLITQMRDLNVLKNKHIPHCYLNNSREVRLQLLAGLIDTDGGLEASQYVITQKRENLIDDIILLSRSLGFYVTKRIKVAKMKRIDGSIYECKVYTASLTLNDYNELPVRVLRKKKTFVNNTRDCLHTRIGIEKDIVDEYFGFEIDGDHLFLLEDFTVTHNTYSIMQVLFTKAVYNPGSVITIVGKDIPFLKKGVMRDAQKIIQDNELLLSFIQDYNKSDRVYQFKNGSIIEFSSFENELDARGGRRDYLYINECNAIPYMTYWQLAIRTAKQIFLDYNPTNRFFVHERILHLPECQLIISDHRHNPFLPQELHDEIEGISDHELFEVYARGRTGRIRGLIFGHFKPIAAIPEDVDKIIWGLDYGYSQDQTALVKIGVKGRQRFIQELCYEPGISADKIKEIIVGNGWNEQQPIYSEHDPIMIAQLRRLRLNVYAARKGPGSKMAGIARVKEFECFYTADSKNLKLEIENYKWVTAEDILTGKEVMTNIPVDGHDHCCDALMYGIFTDSFRQTG